MKSNRENAFSETVPNILQESQENGVILADFNCIIEKKDATRNQDEKMSPSLKRLCATFNWTDTFRRLYPNDLVYSHYYNSGVYGDGATRIDRCYTFGNVTVMECAYVGFASSDHMAIVIKLKLPATCSNHISPRFSPLFKAKPEVVKDQIFKARLHENFTIWKDSRISANIPTLAWWEGTVKPGIRYLLRCRGTEMRQERRGRLNLLLLRQCYLVRRLQGMGRLVGVGGGEARQVLAELRTIQADIRLWYKEASEKIKIHAKTNEINETENVRIYHHTNHQKHIKNSSILKLETENGIIEGHEECMKYIESNVEKTFGVPPELDETAQKKLLSEVHPVFTDADNVMLAAAPTKTEVKKLLWKTNCNSSPGSDGLTYLVYRECWDILGDALTDVVTCLHNGEPETPSQSLSLMIFAPKPKKVNSIKYKDKRTLSLINCDKKLAELIPTNRLKSLSSKGLSPNQLADGDDRKIYHGVNSARDAVHLANSRNESCAMVDIDLVAGFNLVSMLWIGLVLLAKGLTRTNVQRFKNMYKDAVIRVVVNGVIGKAIKVKRCVRQGAPSSMLLFLYNMDPAVVHLENRLQGITLYQMPVLGPVRPGEPALLPIEEKYKVKGYADDLKPVVKSMVEFLLLDAILALFEAASGCQVHRDPQQDKCKILLLGNWKRLQQADIPVEYLKISEFLDMLGLTLKSSFTQTRKVNGEVIQKKYSDTINPWKVGRFMPLVERSWSLNTYALSKVWYKSHCVPLRTADINFINTTTRKWLYADLLVKPADIIKHRDKQNGGLGVFHVKCKSVATLIKSFLETAENPRYIRSQYHQALLAWNVHDDHSIPNPGNNPYYSKEMYNLIKRAVEEGMVLATMSCKDWYKFALQIELEELGPDGSMQLVPCRAELLTPQNNWEHSWTLARLKGLSSHQLTFLWKLLHQLLPTRERQSRILREVNSSVCQVCNTGEIDSLSHALATCPGSREIFNWMKLGLNKFITNLTVEQILLLDINISQPVPFNELPFVWFIAEVLGNLWESRYAGKRCRINEISAAVLAECNTLRKTKYKDISLIIDLMI